MNEQIVIDAAVGEAERPALIAAGEQLGECLSAASGEPWPVRLRLHESLEGIGRKKPPHVVVASLFGEIARLDEPLAATGARYRMELRGLHDCGIGAVFLCTIFRAGGQTMIERIRRLNLLVYELSHETGAGVIDFDRVFTNFGAQSLATDFRLGGPVAAEIAGHAVVGALLDVGLDDVVPPQAAEAAWGFQGSLQEIGRLLERRRAQGEGKAFRG